MNLIWHALFCVYAKEDLYAASDENALLTIAYTNYLHND
jgi:hypothetical protein